MIVVADASVTLKWLLPLKPDEAHVPQAQNLHQRAAAGEIDLLQPPHWIGEVLSLMTRHVSLTAIEAYADFLTTMRYRVADSPPLYRRSAALSISLQHHLFDTLYHAAALLHPSAILVTADERYFRKASHLGRITLLADWQH